MFLWLIVWPLLGSMIICFYKESRNLVGNGTHNLDISIYFSSLSDHIIFRLVKWRERRHCWQLCRLRRWFCDCIKKLRILISYNLEMIIFLPKAKACCFYSTCQRAWKKGFEFKVHQHSHRLTDNNFEQVNRRGRDLSRPHILFSVYHWHNTLKKGLPSICNTLKNQNRWPHC